MDFSGAADLAESLGVFDVLTFDRRVFQVFQSTQGKHFNLVLK